MLFFIETNEEERRIYIGNLYRKIRSYISNFLSFGGENIENVFFKKKKKRTSDKDVEKIIRWLKTIFLSSCKRVNKPKIHNIWSHPKHLLTKCKTKSMPHVKLHHLGVSHLHLYILKWNLYWIGCHKKLLFSIEITMMFWFNMQYASMDWKSYLSLQSLAPMKAKLLTSSSKNSSRSTWSMRPPFLHPRK